MRQVLLIITIFITSAAMAQHDTTYFYSGNAIVYKRANKDIDSMSFTPPPPAIVTDADGNVYPIVTIGTQVWMKENLRVTKYNDGTPIPLTVDAAGWMALNGPGMNWYNDDATAYTANKYGALYNWHTVNTGKLCPTGWHVPTTMEWGVLATFVGGTSGAGGKLKEAGTTHWNSPNTSATDEVGFTALPAGVRSYGDGGSYVAGNTGVFWAADEANSFNGWVRIFSYLSAAIGSNNSAKGDGSSVRCVKD